MVYIPDDGSFELKGRSRAYGFEAKSVVACGAARLLNGALTKGANAFYRGTSAPRVYVDSAPSFMANAALTLSACRGWSGSARMRAINRYRLDGEDATLSASGHTVWIWAFRGASTGGWSST